MKNDTLRSECQGEGHEPVLRFLVNKRFSTPGNEILRLRYAPAQNDNTLTQG